MWDKTCGIEGCTNERIDNWTTCEEHEERGSRIFDQPAEHQHFGYGESPNICAECGQPFGFDEPYGTMEGETPMKLSEFVKKTVDSHGLIDLNGWLADAKQQGVIEDYDQVAQHFVVKVQGRSFILLAHTLKWYWETQRAEKVGPKGLYLDAETLKEHGDDLCAAGYWLASQLAARLTEGTDTPGSKFFGRGSAFRADMEAVAAAGF